MRVSEDRVRQIADRIVEVLLDDELLEWDDKLEALTVKVEKVILEDLAFEDRVTQDGCSTLVGDIGGVHFTIRARRHGRLIIHIAGIVHHAGLRGG